MRSKLLSSIPAWRVLVWSGALLLWITPWILMHFMDQVEWTAFDFVVFASMLIAVCIGIEIAMHLSTRWSYRLAAIIAVGGGFLMVWANLAVGIIGNEENPQNLMFYAVLVIGLAGALFTRFDASGLKWTLRLMAGAQVLVAIIAAALDWALLPVFTLFYVALWLVAAELFNKAELHQLS